MSKLCDTVYARVRSLTVCRDASPDDKCGIATMVFPAADQTYCNTHVASVTTVCVRRNGLTEWNPIGHTFSLRICRGMGLHHVVSFLVICQG